MGIECIFVIHRTTFTGVFAAVLFSACKNMQLVPVLAWSYGHTFPIQFFFGFKNC